VVLKHLKKRLKEIESFTVATLSVQKTSIYKNHNRFRNDKALKGLKMLQTAFKRLDKYNLIVNLDKFFESLNPLANDLKNQKIIYLPTVSICQYWLLTQSQVFKICQRICGLCEHLSKHLLFRIRLGHFWNWASFNFANVSRLW
jgi:hypothetical protein